MIVEIPSFEDAIVKRQRSQLLHLCVNELQIVEWFLVKKDALTQKDSNICLADKSLHKYELTRIYVWNYIDAKFTPDPFKIS